MQLSKIPWTQWTWNPVTGCLHKCDYCYARKLAKRFRKAFPHGFEPHFYPERLNEPFNLKSPALIFVCSMGDLFGDWVPKEWIWSVMDVIRKNPQHIFTILTKNPRRVQSVMLSEGKGYISHRDWIRNLWIGTSVERAEVNLRLNQLSYNHFCHLFASFEPLLADIGYPDLHGFEWIIISPQSNPNVAPPLDSVRRLVSLADDSNIRIFMKPELKKYITPESNIRFRQQFPCMMEPYLKNLEPLKNQKGSGGRTVIHDADLVVGGKCS